MATTAATLASHCRRRGQRPPSAAKRLAESPVPLSSSWLSGCARRGLQRRLSPKPPSPADAPASESPGGRKQGQEEWKSHAAELGYDANRGTASSGLLVKAKQRSPGEIRNLARGGGVGWRLLGNWRRRRASPIVERERAPLSVLPFSLFSLNPRMRLLSLAPFWSGLAPELCSQGSWFLVPGFFFVQAPPPSSSTSRSSRRAVTTVTVAGWLGLGRAPPSQALSPIFLFSLLLPFSS